MGFGTKNRQNHTADACKQHLREANTDKLALVEEFIHEFEGAGKNLDLTRWREFSGDKEEMIRQVDGRFAKWLNPDL